MPITSAYISKNASKMRKKAGFIEKAKKVVVKNRTIIYFSIK
jgi:hypothetical protein